MNNNYPVVAAILIDKKEKKYFVNLGCHPKLEVAAERALTELFQGRNITSFYGMTSIMANPLEEMTNNNRQSILLNGSGIYNIRLFSKTVDEVTKNKIWELPHIDNIDLMNDMINYLKELNFEVYVNHTKFLGLNAVSIVVPGMSELTLSPSDYFREEKRISNVKKVIEKIQLVSRDKLDELKEYLETLSEEANLQHFYNLPLKPGSVLENYRKNILLTMLHIYQHNYLQAYEYSIKWNEELIKSNQDNEITLYYQTISSILACRIKHLSDNEIIGCLSTFYPLSLVEECIEDIKKSNVFNHIPYIKCDNCIECSFGEECKYKNEKELYRILINKKLRTHNN